MVKKIGSMMRVIFLMSSTFAQPLGRVGLMARPAAVESVLKQVALVTPSTGIGLYSGRGLPITKQGLFKQTLLLFLRDISCHTSISPSVFPNSPNLKS